MAADLARAEPRPWTTEDELVFLRNLSRGLLGGHSRGIRLRSNWGDLDAGAVRRELARILGDELKKFRREGF